MKTEVRELGRHLGIPEKIIQKAPLRSWPGQSDEKELGISYGELDNYILTGEASAEAKRLLKGWAAEKVPISYNPSPCRPGRSWSKGLLTLEVYSPCRKKGMIHIYTGDGKERLLLQ